MEKDGFLYSITGYYLLWKEKRKLYKAIDRLAKIRKEHAKRYLVERGEIERD